MNPDREEQERASGGVLQAVRRLWVSQAKRPLSFYLLLATPLVLLLSVHTFLNRADPVTFAFGLSVLFVFAGVLLARAVVEVLEIGRVHLRESGRAYRETLGDDAFTHELGERVDSAKRER